MDMLLDGVVEIARFIATGIVGMILFLLAIAVIFLYDFLEDPVSPFWDFLFNDKTCPHCRNKIPKEATVCHFCVKDTPPELTWF